MANFGKFFGMNILIYDPYVNEEDIENKYKKVEINEFRNIFHTL